MGSETFLPKVTVIIPCYNRGKFIRETLDSTLSQTYRDLEIVAVDDGSTDDTREILESYGKKIRILEHPGRVNKGQSAAINLAMRSTQSKYVAILDSDDIWAPKKIEKQVEFLEKYPDIGLVYANGFDIDDNGKILYKRIQPGHVETNDPGRVLLECHFNIPSNALVLRTVIEAAGDFDESMRSAQDHDMAIRLAEITRLAYLDESLWYYRRHSDTQSMLRRRWEIGFRILDKASKRYPYSFSIKRKRLADLHFRLGQCLIEGKEYLHAMEHFILAGLFDPIRAINVIIGRERISGPH